MYIRPIIWFVVLTLNISIAQTNPYSFRTLDKNNLKLSINNRTEYTSNLISWFNNGYEYNLSYDHGPWIVGKMNNKFVLAVNQWNNNYSPGPIINGEPAMLIYPDFKKYRLYKVSIGDNFNNPDFAEWPVDLGAPVKKDSTPFIYGDQNIWTIFNSNDSTVEPAVWQKTNFPPLEFHQLVYCRKDSTSYYNDILDNIILMEWTIINKGLFSLESAYFGFWADIDISWFDDRPGIDTLNQLGYCWTPKYYFDTSKIAPAFGYALLYGPAVQAPGSNALFKGRIKKNYKNLKLNSFHAIGDDYYIDTLINPVPSYNITEAENMAKGLYPKGSPIINPVTNQITTFPFSGNPVTAEGWIYNMGSGSGAGFVFFSGPFNLAPNDTQWVMIAAIPGLGSTYLSSIESLQNRVKQLRNLPYDSLANIEKDTSLILNPPPKFFRLFQNYPNPFNPITTIIWETPEDSWQTLKVFDILGREVAILINEEKPAGTFEVQFDASSLSSGIYFYELRTESFSTVKKMILLR